MKKTLIHFVAISALFIPQISGAVHGYITDSGSIQYCSDRCDSVNGLEEGSLFSLAAQMDVTDVVLNTISEFTIEILGSNDSIILNPLNTSLVSSNIFTSTDGFEQTSILGGSALFDTTAAFSDIFFFSSTLAFDFDNNRIDFQLIDIGPRSASELIASTAVVPVPSAFILFCSGILALVSLSKRK